MGKLLLSHNALLLSSQDGAFSHRRGGQPALSPWWPHCKRNAFGAKHPIFYLVKHTPLTFGLITITTAAIFLLHIVPKAHLSLLWEVWKAGPILPLKVWRDLPQVTEVVSEGVGNPSESSRGTTDQT